MTAVLASQEAQTQLSKEGAEVVRMNPADFGAYIAKELAKWEKVVKAAGIKAE